jgi:hypothetical protein
MTPEQRQLARADREAKARRVKRERTIAVLVLAVLIPIIYLIVTAITKGFLGLVLGQN